MAPLSEKVLGRKRGEGGGYVRPRVSRAGVPGMCVVHVTRACVGGVVSGTARVWGNCIMVGYSSKGTQYKKVDRLAGEDEYTSCTS